MLFPENTLTKYCHPILRIFHTYFARIKVVLHFMQQQLNLKQLYNNKSTHDKGKP